MRTKKDIRKLAEKFCGENSLELVSCQEGNMLEHRQDFWIHVMEVVK